MKKGTVLIISGLVLIGAAIGLAAYNIWDGSRAGAESESVLEKLRPMIKSEASEVTSSDDGTACVSGQSGDEEKTNTSGDTFEEIIPDYILNPEIEVPACEVDGDKYIGILSLPTLSKEFPVMSEWSEAGSKRAPCRYSGSPYLDNFVIAAHNYFQHFGSLGDMRIGDSVYFFDMDGNRFEYFVTEIETLPGTEVEAMIAGNDDLTLFTCDFSGSNRVTVRCNKAD